MTEGYVRLITGGGWLLVLAVIAGAHALGYHAGRRRRA
jgi:hypothetical protein